MTMPQPQYVYRAALIRVIDADTIVLRRDCGERIYRDTPIRLLGVNAPELHGTTAEAGRLAAHWASSWLTDSPQGEWPLIVATQLDKDDKYGRLLGTIYRLKDFACLNDDLLAAGHAVPYDGGQR